MRTSRKVGTAFLATALALAATTVMTVSAGAGGREARAVLSDVSGTVVGVVRLDTEAGGKILLRVSASGLSPGFHGFHIHGIGICDPAATFASAGGHFNPAGAPHPTHAGDQPVLLVNTDGTAIARFETDRYMSDQLFDGDGSAFIVHALPDNYANVTRYGTPDTTTLATGDAGARIACGVITP